VPTEIVRRALGEMTGRTIVVPSLVAFVVTLVGSIAAVEVLGTTVETVSAGVAGLADATGVPFKPLYI
jgi:hypothetical protein